MILLSQISFVAQRLFYFLLLMGGCARKSVRMGV